ncbi:hypothetical protein BDR03DRAFT_1013844 [Suillus americanus]|nr:hypothetical protein BDR03DRAFT_1013844 [Suillus americanus]
MPSSQTVPSRQRVSQDVPIIRQAGLNIAGHSSADQLGCVSETPESMNTPELPPRINPPPVFLHDGYSSIPPSYQPEGGDTASRYCMVYTYMPLRGAEKSRQEYTDGVIYRDETTGIQKTSTWQYQLPPIRPPRESLAADSESTLNAATSSTPQFSTSTLQSSALAVTVSHTGRWQGEGCSGATVVPVIDKVHMKIIVKDVKESVIAETVNTCGFNDSSSHLSVATTALSDACSSIIVQDHLIKLWVSKNISALYKTIITSMSTILNRFKKRVQDLVKNLYELQLMIWTDPIVQVNHNKSTVDFLTGNNRINYIFGGLVRVHIFLQVLPFRV